jgi:hypothetical protein
MSFREAWRAIRRSDAYALERIVSSVTDERIFLAKRAARGSVARRS